MFKTLLSTLLVGLSLWDKKESRKYTDRAMELKRKYYEEINKPESDRSDAVLDNLEFELRILADSFSSRAKAENA